jgi:tRNA threonylcarbamoyladenosine biosynthesis protein TsaE
MNYLSSLSFESSSPAATEALGKQLGGVLPRGAAVTLSGELGAGKTVFVRGLARGWGVTGPITSPSYVLEHVYRGERGTLYHLDAYRLAGGLAEFEASGLHEALADAAALVCVEWHELLGEVQWPPERIDIQFEHLAPDLRRLTLRAFGPQVATALQKSE